uniref:RING-type E3 ubiquitin transferase n=1 Tax=Chromera velia CCMP2878 TaxID=1169474 RepID=A0A0G4FGF3_9ALVE|eukprot:Cvel_3297.t1-p1 / transcript=Cvel_3297.t1 / gene=Cvel_3297 / organism=Chromera_velia_CCMP2878 / gene_product=Transmembrane E3 ubiquitin-protein ligase 1, putative / transcript_product=Transmembrane E3 ubiquitin-protein ligase 1, putative / location=Cvel_scaffold130:90879-96369(-) / protein_length=761 / sequence_SO=supercontig / SO=protein_coding / is_pseudo=false
MDATNNAQQTGQGGDSPTDGDHPQSRAQYVLCLLFGLLILMPWVLFPAAMNPNKYKNSGEPSTSPDGISYEETFSGRFEMMNLQSGKRVVDKARIQLSSYYMEMSNARYATVTIFLDNVNKGHTNAITLTGGLHLLDQNKIYFQGTVGEEDFFSFPEDLVTPQILHRGDEKLEYRPKSCSVDLTLNLLIPEDRFQKFIKERHAALQNSQWDDASTGSERRLSLVGGEDDGEEEGEGGESQFFSRLPPSPSGDGTSLGDLSAPFAVGETGGLLEETEDGLLTPSPFLSLPPAPEDLNDLFQTEGGADTDSSSLSSSPRRSTLSRDHDPALDLFGGAVHGRPGGWKVDVVGKAASGDCGWLLQFAGEEIDMQKLGRKVLILSVIMEILTVVQIVLFAFQIFQSATSGGGKVSLASLAMMIYADVLEVWLLFAAAAHVRFMYTTLYVMALFKFGLVSLVEIRFVLTVFRYRNEQNNANEDGWTQVRSELMFLYGRYHLVAMLLVILVHALPFLLVPLALILSLYWLPQIARDAWTGNRNSLHPNFIMGTTLCRLVLPLYVWGCPATIFNGVVYPSAGGPMFGLALTMLIVPTVQVWLMFLQRRFGPRCFIPRGLLPHVYNYYRPVPVRELQALEEGRRGGTTSPSPGSPKRGEGEGPKGGDEEEGMGRDGGDTETETGTEASTIGGTAAGLQGGLAGLGLECVICMNEIQMDEAPSILPAFRRSSSQIRVVTPCDHVFHEACLIKWMEVKMECPTCRRNLPPLV